MKNIAIGKRLGLGFALLILITIIVSMVTVRYMKILSGFTVRLYRHPYTVNMALLHIESDIIRMHRSMKDVALAKDSAETGAAVRAVAEHEKCVYKQFEIVFERFLGDKRKVDRARNLFAEWKPIRDEVIALMYSGEREKAAEITKNKGAKYVEVLQKAILEFRNFASDKADEFFNNAEKLRDKAFFITYLSVSVSLITGFLLALLISGSIRKSLKFVMGGLDESSEQLNSVSCQISSSGQVLARRSSEQAISVEETSSALEEIFAMTSQGARNSDHTNKLMKDATACIEKANGTLTELVFSIDEISDSSRKASEIIGMIDKIAFKTNILSLNAAIEAARSGEAGSGFAVVAEEVRSLALQTAEAVKTTDELIENTEEKISEGSELVKTTANAFSQVLTTISKAGELIEDISAAYNEQAEGVMQINKAVTGIDKTAQRNAMSAKESAAASEEMNAQVLQIRLFMNEMMKLVGTNGKKQCKERKMLPLRSCFKNIGEPKTECGN